MEATTLPNSLERSLNDLFPGEVQHQNDPPTAINLARGIDLWVKWWFKKTLTSNLHFEHQLYGPDNTYLQSIFPAARRFAIIPQALLRTTIVENAIEPRDLNVSIGSTGGTHWGRKSGRSNIGKSLPDFFAVKVFATPETEPRKHYVVCVVEVKLGDLNDVKPGDNAVLQAEEQMAGYMNNLIPHPYRVKKLKGYLLIRDKYLEYQITDDGVDYVPGAYKKIFAPGDPLTLALCQIAVEEWNRTLGNAQLEVPNVLDNLELL